MLHLRIGLVAYAIACLATGCAAPAATDAGAGADATHAYVDVSTDRPVIMDVGSDVLWDVPVTVAVTPFDAAYRDALSPADAAAADARAGDANASPCMALADLYAQAVRNAQSCTDGAQCSVLVCETLCCNCNVYVNAMNVGPLLDQMRNEWHMGGCAAIAPCSAMACDAPVSAACSSTGRCTTLRTASHDR
jgi:hypothetical protein